VIRALREANKVYEDKIAFVYVDWDQHHRSPISKSLNIRRQSTLVLLNARGEVGRLVAATSKASIKSLLDKALEH